MLQFYAIFICLTIIYIRGNYIHYMIVWYAQNVSGVKTDVFTSLWRTDVRFGEKLADRFRFWWTMTDQTRLKGRINGERERGVDPIHLEHFMRGKWLKPILEGEPSHRRYQRPFTEVWKSSKQPAVGLLINVTKEIFPAELEPVRVDRETSNTSRWTSPSGSVLVRDLSGFIQVWTNIILEMFCWHSSRFNFNKFFCNKMCSSYYGKPETSFQWD